RSHMGVHILRAVRNVSDTVINPVDGLLPCGFCGRSDNPDCAVTLKKLARRTIQWDSNCPRKEGFQYGSADKGSNNRPCHNVPVVCRLCIHRNKDTDWRTAIWRYNLEAHLTKEHPEYANPGKLEGVALPRVVFDSVVLTAAEEKRAGVP
ncbi:hypothetical protein EV424DRAFT_1269338, partial [Suillus variegatus]